MVENANVKNCTMVPIQLNISPVFETEVPIYFFSKVLYS